MLVLHFAMSHISHWIDHLYFPLLKWKSLAQLVLMTPVLIHLLIHPPVIMVHEDAITIVLPLDHPDIMIGIVHPDRITVVIRIIETSQKIGITTIEIGITALANMIGDIRTRMVSPRLGTLMITITPILHKIG